MLSLGPVYAAELLQLLGGRKSAAMLKALGPDFTAGDARMSERCVQAGAAYFDVRSLGQTWAPSLEHVVQPVSWSMSCSQSSLEHVVQPVSTAVVLVLVTGAVTGGRGLLCSWERVRRRCTVQGCPSSSHSRHLPTLSHSTIVCFARCICRHHPGGSGA
jgi:hypothetical protein